MADCLTGSSTYLFHVRVGFPVTVAAQGLIDDETFVLYYVIYQDVGDENNMFPVKEEGKEIVLNNDNNPLYIMKPGAYKLVSENVESDHRIYVTEHKVCK